MQDYTTCLPASGSLDGLTGSNQLGGWAWIPGQGIPIAVEIRDDGEPIGRVVANVFRQDLREAGIGDGRHGFLIDLPLPCCDGRFHEVTLHAHGEAGSTAAIAARRVAFPRRRAGNLPRGIPAAALLNTILGSAGAPGSTAFDRADIDALVAAARGLASRFGDDTALALLYVHLLHRRIDGEGLAMFLEHLATRPGDFEGVAEAILASPERRKLGRNGRIAPLSGLTAWLDAGQA